MKRSGSTTGERRRRLATSCARRSSSLSWRRSSISRDAAGGLDPARRAGLLGPGSGGVAADDGRLGQQRPPARAQDGRRTAPEQSQQATLHSLGDERIRELVAAYVDAWARGDVDAVRALLAEDAVFSMPPWAAWWRGRDTIGGFAKEAVEFCAASLPVSTQANGQPAIAYYHLDAETGRYKATAIDVISLEAR